MRNPLQLNPPMLYKMSIAMMLVIWMLPTGKVFDFPLVLAGLPLLVVGILIAMKAKNLFKKTGTPMSPAAEPTRLHRDGVFRYSRNPMYLGIVVGLLGIAILTGNVINLIFPLTYSLIMDMYFIKKEENNLEEKFGETFRIYKRTTRRWI